MEHKEWLEIPEETKKELAKIDFLCFCKYFAHTVLAEWRDYEVHRYVCQIIQDLHYNLNEFDNGKENNKVVISMPPQHGKSFIVAVFYPVFYLLQNPKSNVLYVTYGDSLSKQKATLVKALSQSVTETYFGTSKINSKISDFKMFGDGSFYSVGVGGGITGRGFDLIIMDDLIKNHEEADSELQRDKLKDYYNTAILTRRSNTANEILIMTRWHNDDIASRLLDGEEDEHGNKTGSDFRLYNFPAVCIDPETDLLNRKLGEPLCPEVKSNNFLKNARVTMSGRHWQCLYLGTPTDDDGAFFKREYFQYFSYDEERLYWEYQGKKESETKYNIIMFQTIDTAYEENDNADFFVITTFAVAKEKLFIIDLYRERLSTVKHIETVKRYRDKWTPWLVFQGIENKGSGINILQALKKEGLPIKEFKADRNKRLRAEFVKVAYEQGLVYHLKGASFNDVMEVEMLQFPLGRNDDIVDTIAYGGEQFYHNYTTFANTHLYKRVE